MISGYEAQTKAVVYSQSPEASELFLKTREQFNKRDPRTGGALANARQAIRLYEQAVKTDPKLALAFVELSRAWMTLGYSDPDGITGRELLYPREHAPIGEMRFLWADAIAIEIYERRQDHAEVPG
jgi:hypothetical protein